MLAGETPRLSIFLYPRTRNPAFDQLEDQPMNLSEPFFNNSTRERYGEIFQLLVHLVEEALPVCLGLPGATDNADANGERWVGSYVRKRTQTRGNGLELRADDTNIC